MVDKEILSDTSVVVATHERMDMLKDLLDSFSQLDYLPGDVIVVDDGSEKEVAPSLQKDTYPYKLKVFRNEEPKGPAGARNVGVHRSRGDIIAFTDDDCIVESGWLKNLHSHLKNADEMLGGVGGKVKAYDDDIFSRYYEFKSILEPRPHDREHPNRIPYLVTANCAVTREAFMRAGGFDENIDKAGGDDCAMSMRMAKSDYYFEKEEDAVIFHRFKKGFRNLYRTFYRYGKGGRYVVDRYLPL